MWSTRPEQVHLGEPPLHWEFLDIKVKVSLIYLVIYLSNLSRSRWFAAETGDAELICADAADAPIQTKELNLRFQLELIHEACLTLVLSRRRGDSEFVDVIFNNFRFTQN